MYIYKWYILNCTLNQDRLGDGESWISETSPGVHIWLSLNKLFAVQQLLYRKSFQSQTFSLTFVLLKTHCKNPKSYESSKELLSNVYWLSTYFHLVYLIPTWKTKYWWWNEISLGLEV